MSRSTNPHPLPPALGRELLLQLLPPAKILVAIVCSAQVEAALDELRDKDGDGRAGDSDHDREGIHYVANERAGRKRGP